MAIIHFRELHEPGRYTQREALAAIIASAKSVGVSFLERVSDGGLVVEHLDHLAPDDRRELEARLADIRAELLPADHSTSSLHLLAEVDVELIYTNTEERTAAEVQRICRSVQTLGLDLETAPRPDAMPAEWPIAVTKDGRRSRVQSVLDTSAALDPFRAKARLLQVAAQIGKRMVALVVDLRGVPLGSSALMPLWDCRLIGHNLGFDAKVLAANGVQIADGNLVDTLLMAGLLYCVEFWTRVEKEHGGHPLLKPSKRHWGLNYQRKLSSRLGGVISSRRSRSRMRHSTPCSLLSLLSRWQRRSQL